MKLSQRLKLIYSDNATSSKIPRSYTGSAHNEWATSLALPSTTACPSAMVPRMACNTPTSF